MCCNVEGRRYVTLSWSTVSPGAPHAFIFISMSIKHGGWEWESKWHTVNMRLCVCVCLWVCSLCVGAPSAKCPLGPAAFIKTDILQYSKRQPIELPLCQRNTTTLWGLIQQSGRTDKSSQHEEKKNHKRTRDTERSLIMILLFWSQKNKITRHS